MTKTELNWIESQGSFFLTFEEYQEAYTMLHCYTDEFKGLKNQRYAIITKQDEVIWGCRIYLYPPFRLELGRYVLSRELGRHISFHTPEGSIYDLCATEYYCLLEVEIPKKQEKTND